MASTGGHRHDIDQAECARTTTEAISRKGEGVGSADPGADGLGQGQA
jgi:hypothetical protein